MIVKTNSTYLLWALNWESETTALDVLRACLCIESLEKHDLCHVWLAGEVVS